MSEGQHRYTALAAAPRTYSERKFGEGETVATVSSFRSNMSDDHFVVGFQDGIDSDDDSPMGYVDVRAAVDLASHFVAIANELGASLHIVKALTSDYVARVEAEAFELGYAKGRDGEAAWRDEQEAAVAALLRDALGGLNCQE